MLHSAGIGLDVHARSISAAALAFGTGGAVQRTSGCGPDAVAAWAATLPQPAGCLCESGPTGFGLQGRPVALGLPCHAGAVPGGRYRRRRTYRARSGSGDPWGR